VLIFFFGYRGLWPLISVGRSSIQDATATANSQSFGRRSGKIRRDHRDPALVKRQAPREQLCPINLASALPAAARRVALSFRFTISLIIV
jgi:hypothetical protein